MSVNPALKKFCYPFLLPNGLLCAMVLFGLSQRTMPATFLPLLKIAPIAVAVVGLLLGWRFNRIRLIYAVGLLLLAELSLNVFARGDDPQLLFRLVGLLLPLNLLLVSWFREKGLVNIRGGFWLLVLASECVVAAWLLSAKSRELEVWLNYPLFDLPLLSPLPLPQLVFLVNVLVLLLMGLRYLVKPGAFEASFFWAQLVILVGQAGFSEQPLRLYLTSAGIILILGIMETSYCLAYRDELTGLPGRRALNETLEKLGSRYTLAMLDIDHFKKFNDTHGHDVGDQVLRMVASRLATVSGGGKVYRYGGEEFTVVFPRKSVAAASVHLEVIRLAVEEARFIPRGKDRPKKKPKKRSRRSGTQAKSLRVTISIGAAERGGSLGTSAAVIKAADQALYRAKKAGRNQLCS